MVHLNPVTMGNLDAVLMLKVKEDQKRFVSSTAESLAQAYVCSKTAFPFAVYNDEIIVGFENTGLFENGMEELQLRC